MTSQFTERAIADVENCLEWSGTHFGEAAARRYRQLIIVAVAELTADPNPPGSKRLGDLHPSIGIYHLRHSRKRAAVDGAIVKRPRHLIVYRVVGSDVLEVVRVLDESMDPERHDTGLE